MPKNEHEELETIHQTVHGLIAEIPLRRSSMAPAWRLYLDRCAEAGVTFPITWLLDG